MLQQGNDHVHELTAFGSSIERNKPSLGFYYNLFLIMLYGGLRVSEALQIRPGDINPFGQIFIKASKGSDNRLVSCAPLTTWLLKCRANSFVPFVHCDRFSAYRHLKNIGVGRQKKGRVNVSVTHALRDEYVKLLRAQGLDNSDISLITGHKKSENLEYYGKD